MGRQGRATIRFPLGGMWENCETPPNENPQGLSKETPVQSPDAHLVDQEKTQLKNFVSAYIRRVQELALPVVGDVDLDSPLFDSENKCPPRPRLGTREMMRGYFRRFAKALLEEVADFREGLSL